MVLLQVWNKTKLSSKSGKSIFLLDSINPDLRTQTIEIISDRYNELSERYMNYDNE